MGRLSRRRVLGAASAAAVRAMLPAESAAQDVPVHNLVADLPGGITRSWLGPDFWANRLQDWRLHDGRIECLANGENDQLRTVAILTREVVAGRASGVIGARFTLIEDAGAGGFCGFLIGAGGGNLDYRAAALVQKASGEGGGILCVYHSEGRRGFMDHTQEETPLRFQPIPESGTREVPPRHAIGSEIALQLQIVPTPDDRFNLVLRTLDNPRAYSQITVAEKDILGGILLVSSPQSGARGARYAIRDLRCGGDKIANRPERALGPILGTLYSLSNGVLKLSAQMMPVGDVESQSVRLVYGERSGDGIAPKGEQTVPIGSGYSAQFRIERWDASKDWAYSVDYPAEPVPQHSWQGIIGRDPVDRDPLTIGHLSCTIATARSLEGGIGRRELPQAETLGRYTHKNFYFPHRELAANVAKHKPDLLVFAGDQLYEGNPTRRDPSENPTLDYLYKWYLWLWSFRELTRGTPTIVQTDDHDVYHPNLWGNGGRRAPEGDYNRGGYRCTGEFVNLVQRTQCGHNPDAFDPTPVDQGIGCYYAAFRYGGVSFAILEDRKFKTAPIQGADLDVHEAELLGERQERFLREWSKMHTGAARICLSQSCFACLQTSPSGRPLLDFDSNGYPKLGRDTAIRLLRDAGALVLAGDQHLATMALHGIDSFTDGVPQFTGPAAGSSWQRWFEPADPLHNARGPHTGDFVDAFGNKTRVLAVANPKVTFAEYRKHIPGRGQGLGDRKLKSEGYGIVLVNKNAKRFTIECWHWKDNRQFDGWPVRIPFGQSSQKRH